MTKINKMSKANAPFQVFESIKRSREKRNEHKLFLLEGVKPINIFLEYNGEVEAVLYSSDTKLTNWGQKIVSNANIAYEIVPALFEQLSDKENVSEIIVVGKITSKELPEIMSDKSIFLVLDRPRNPGNLGSIIRSADAVGVTGIAVLGHSTDLYNPQTIRSSIGSCFATPVQFFGSNESFLNWLENLKEHKTNVQVVGTSAKAEKTLAEHNFTDHTVLLVGNETLGLSAFLKDLSDVIVSIPMVGVTSSLNIACATTVVLYKIKNG